MVNPMLRMRSLVTLVGLVLLVASAGGSAQTLAGHATADATASQTNDATLEHTNTASYDGEASGSAEADAYVEAHLGIELESALPEVPSTTDDDGELSGSAEAEATVELVVDIVGADDLELPSQPTLPSNGGDDGDEADPDPDADEETEDETNVSEDDDDANAGGNASVGGSSSSAGAIDANASAHGEAHVSVGSDNNNGDDGEPVPPTHENETDADDDEHPDDMETMPQVRPDTAVDAALEVVSTTELSYAQELRQQVETYLRFKAGDVVITPPAEEPDAPDRDDEDAPIEAEPSFGRNGGEFNLGLDASGAFEASTRGLTGAFSAVSGTVERIVGSIAGAFQAEAHTETAVEVATEVAAVPGVEGNGTLGAAGDVTSTLVGGIDGTVANAEAPALEMPTANASAEGEAHSETKLSSGLTGDVGFGL